MPFASTNFFLDLVLFSHPQLVVIDKDTSARSGADNRTVTIGFFYDGGTGADQAGGYNVEWLGVTSGGKARGFFGGEPTPHSHSFKPSTPKAGKPQNAAADTYDANGVLHWLGSFQVDAPSGQTEETTYHGELQLTN